MSQIRLLPLLLVVACGGSSGGATGPPQDPGPGPGPGGQNPPLTASVQLRSETDPVYGDESHSFVPSQVTIARTGRVTWTNSTGLVHNVTFANVQGAPASVPDFGSGSPERTFNTAGTFNYQCTLHAGMTGQVSVQ